MSQQAGRGATRPQSGLLLGSPGHSPGLDATAVEGHCCPLAPLVVRPQHPGRDPQQVLAELDLHLMSMEEA